MFSSDISLTIFFLAIKTYDIQARNHISKHVEIEKKNKQSKNTQIYKMM